jgi:hypothetical protein
LAHLAKTIAAMRTDPETETPNQPTDSSMRQPGFFVGLARNLSLGTLEEPFGEFPSGHRLLVDRWLSVDRVFSVGGRLDTTPPAGNAVSQYSLSREEAPRLHSE